MTSTTCGGKAAAALVFWGIIFSYISKLTGLCTCRRIDSFLLEGFPSGQRDQTVNLTAQPSEVRILPPPPPK